MSGEAEDPEAVLGRIKEYIRALSEKGVDEADFERSRRVLYAEFVKDFDSTEEVAYNMIDFIFDDADLLSFGDKLMKVSLDDINELLETAFLDEYVSLSVIRPKRKENL